MDDLLTSNEGGKHDYDWLLTPPETPLNNHRCSAERSELHHSGRAGRRSNSASRPASATKSSSSRLSKTQAQSDIAPKNMRPTRSSTVSRSSFSHALSSSSRYRTSTDNILNTSSKSVSSYIRPSSPISTGTSTSNTRLSSSTTSARRLSTPSSSSSSRYSTPSKCRTSAAALPACSSIDDEDDNNKPRSSVRDTKTPTPTSLTLRPHINRSSSPSPSPILSRSRPSTPTRRHSISSVMSAAAAHSISASDGPANGLVLRDIALDDGPPQNLITTTEQHRSHRPVSAGCRSRPSAAYSSSVSLSRRRPSSPTPLVSSSLRRPDARTSVVLEPSNGSSSSRRSSTISYVPETSGGVGRRLVKLGNATPDANGSGRNITKKSLDMADVRGGPRRSTTLPVSLISVTGTVLYPQSIRSISTNKGSYGYASSNSSSSVSSSSDNLNLMNGRLSCDHYWNCKHDGSSSSGTTLGSPDNIIRLAREDNHHTDFNNDGTTGAAGRSVLISKVDNIFESSRYDAFLLNKDDVQNLNWLHGGAGDDPNLFLFENSFEALPEPFGLS